MNPADSETNYAYWTDPQNRFTVTYSLSVLHDIDFQASEGFRRIPHGGIETGGLLFGQLKEAGSRYLLQIDAFRPIACEHAAGPSFTLSERDLAGLREQIAASGSDPELEGMQVLGWFVAHTRSALEMNEREATLFGQLFPGPGRLLLLVKPERFQATRFAFLARGTDGRVERDGSANAIILPLSGRAGRAPSGPAASIPAPGTAQPTPLQAPAAPSENPPPSFWSDVPVAEAQTHPVVSIEEPQAEPGKGQVGGGVQSGSAMQVTPPAIDEDIREQIKRARNTNTQRTRPEGNTQRARSEVIPQRPRLEGSTETPRSEGVTQRPFAEVAGAEEQRITRRIRQEEGPFVARLVVLLILAAGLGCLAGYVAYLQLPPATIALEVQPPTTAEGTKTRGLIVSWPAEETRDAIFASISVDNNEAIPLTAQERTAGRALVVVGGDDVKIELIAQRRWRDSRGIVRFVRAKKISR